MGLEEVDLDRERVDFKLRKEINRLTRGRLTLRATSVKVEGRVI